MPGEPRVLDYPLGVCRFVVGRILGHSRNGGEAMRPSGVRQTRRNRGDARAIKPAAEAGADLNVRSQSKAYRVRQEFAKLCRSVGTG